MIERENQGNAAAAGPRRFPPALPRHPFPDRTSVGLLVCAERASNTHTQETIRTDSQSKKTSGTGADSTAALIRSEG